MADAKRPTDEELLAALEEEKPAPPPVGSLQYVRRLVKMNPAMKPAGLNTEQAAAQLSTAITQAKQKVADQAADTALPKEDARNANVGPAQSIGDAVATAKKQVQTDLQAITAQQADLQARAKKIQKDLAALEEKKTLMTNAACDAFIDRVLAIDRHVTSPKTQVVLRSEQTFLTSIGFSMERLVAREKKR